MKRVYLLFAIPALILLSAPPAAAQSVESFYKNRTVKLLIGAGAGGTFNLYGQLLGAHIGRHIPGKPTVVVSHMPGGGGRKLANYMHNAAPKDGSVMALTIHTVPISQLIQTRGIKYDAGQWNWLGNMAVLVNVIGIWHTNPVKTLAQAKQTQVILGGTGRAGPMSTFPLIVNQLLGTKFKVINGYKSVGGVDKVLESGELQGRAGSSLSWTLQRQDWLKAGKINFIIQLGQKKNAALPADVPVWTDLAKTPADREVMMFLASASEVSRSVFVPQGVPGDRVAALQKAFDATMNDPVFLADAKKRGMPIVASTGAQTLAKIKTILATPKSLVNRVISLRKKAIKKKKK